MLASLVSKSFIIAVILDYHIDYFLEFIEFNEGNLNNSTLKL